MSDPELERLREEYRSSLRRLPQDTSHPWHPLNPAALHYRLGRERAVSSLLRRHILSLERLRCLDIGCGFGAELRFLLSAGARPEHIYGIELLPERARIARRTNPHDTSVIVGDAGSLPFPDGSFDLATQYTVFSSITSKPLRVRTAAEISRILKPGGYLLWYDMHRTRSQATRGISRTEIQESFLGMGIIYITQLHSLYTTRLVRISPLLCEFFDLLPGLPKTHYLALLQKSQNSGANT